MTATRPRRSPAVQRRRLDQLLVERGLAPSLGRARALILAREVEVDGAVALRAAAPLSPQSKLRVKRPPRYVGRGGDKLEAALRRSGIDVSGLRCLDIGASTGGFTDCLLQRGAEHVTAVDSGYGQLATKLRDDPRVEVRERTNARLLAPLAEPVGLVVADVSFISLTAVLPVAVASLCAGGDVLALVKPQFEVAREQVERGGVVRDPLAHASAVAKVALWAVGRGLRVRGVLRSPLTGPAGNREFFLWLRRAAAAP